ncbi:hypothetical protein BS78_02G400600 [Paspalum vaginatum]|nr:hypothetical protein BS78_02G400600 [Paspalum vaginatum]
MDRDGTGFWVNLNPSEREDESREGVCGLVGAAALPADALLVGEAGDGEVGVEVLAQLGDYPIGAHGPGVHPVVSAAHPFGDDGGGAQGVDGARREAEAAAAAAGGEQAHHVLVLGRAMEPPLQVRGQQRLHARVVARVQRLVQTEHEELVALLLRLLRLRLLAAAAVGGSAVPGWLPLQLKLTSIRPE